MPRITPFLWFDNNAEEAMAFNTSIPNSSIVDCADQAEVDHSWDALTADGGEPGQCDWLMDRFGLSWPIVPKARGELTAGPDPARSAAVVRAMLQMVEIDVATLPGAYDQA